MTFHWGPTAAEWKLILDPFALFRFGTFVRGHWSSNLLLSKSAIDGSSSCGAEISMTLRLGQSSSTRQG